MSRRYSTSYSKNKKSGLESEPVLLKKKFKKFSRVRLGISYYHLTTCVAAIALALVMSLMAQAQQDDTTATDMTNTNELANPATTSATPMGTSSGTTFSDSEQKKMKKSAIKKESGVRGEMQKAHDTQTLGSTPTPTPSAQ